MKIKGFINIYPSTELGAQGSILHNADSHGNHIESEVRTGCGVFPTNAEADNAALPSRITVAEFEYDKVVTVTRYRNVYERAEKTQLSRQDYASEAEALQQARAYFWWPYHIGVMSFTKEF